ncbi:single-stranded DNA-binding protein [uncultured Cardiobacterium sp.]|uniref:single-stranded DNA-binding protein n=1 Tax=uncultured Cardiobacterium sp. TaxID=417619 RepID=UPI00262B1FE1|nr:single-stranded DNA-binding protein [uncultured Cardiobacterium sp.]
MGAKITLHGNLGDDPRHGVAKNRLGEDLPWVSFSMRQPHWVRENNEPVDKGGFWINVSWFSRKAEVAATLLKKGAAVIVSGDLHVEFWTDQETGELRSGFKVNADEVGLDMRALSGVTYRNRSFQGP